MPTQKNPIQKNVSNQQLPADGPKFVPLSFDLSTQQTEIVDLLNYSARGFINAIQTMFVDNSTNTAPLILAFGQPASQIVKIPPGAQGYFSILVPEPYFVISTLGTPSNVSVLFLNVPIAPSIWFPSGAAGFKFDATGNLETVDQNLAPAIIAGIVQVSGSSGGGGGGLKPNIFKWGTMHDGVNAIDNLLGGAAGIQYYLRSLDVSVTGDATQPTAGMFTIKLLSSNNIGGEGGGEVILSKSIYLPSVAPSIIPPNYQIFKFEAMQAADLVSAGGAPYFAITMSSGLNTGHVDVNAGGGLLSAG